MHIRIRTEVDLRIYLGGAGIKKGGRKSLNSHIFTFLNKKLMFNLHTVR